MHKPISVTFVSLDTWCLSYQKLQILVYIQVFVIISVTCTFYILLLLINMVC
jgi:hypothetical protein